MKSLISLIFTLIFGTSVFANTCTCDPIVESKNYIGEARQKRLFGYSIHWTCTYHCRVISNDNEVTQRADITGEYNEHFWGSENGDEGVCEGMDYSESQYNSDRNDFFYIWNGRITPFAPSESKATSIKAWGRENNCD